MDDTPLTRKLRAAPEGALLRSLPEALQREARVKAQDLARAEGPLSHEMGIEIFKNMFTKLKADPSFAGQNCFEIASTYLIACGEEADRLSGGRNGRLE